MSEGNVSQIREPRYGTPTSLGYQKRFPVVGSAAHPVEPFLIRSLKGRSALRDGRARMNPWSNEIDTGAATSVVRRSRRRTHRRRRGQERISVEGRSIGNDIIPSTPELGLALVDNLLFFHALLGIDDSLPLELVVEGRKHGMV